MGLALKLSKRVRTLDEGLMQCIDHKLNTALQKSSEANEILYEAFTRARNLARRGMSTAQNRVFEAPSNFPNKVELPPQNDNCSIENERIFPLSEEAQF